MLKNDLYYKKKYLKYKRKYLAMKMQMQMQMQIGGERGGILDYPIGHELLNKNGYTFPNTPYFNYEILMQWHNWFIYFTGLIDAKNMYDKLKSYEKCTPQKPNLEIGTGSNDKELVIKNIYGPLTAEILQSLNKSKKEYRTEIFNKTDTKAKAIIKNNIYAFEKQNNIKPILPAEIKVFNISVIDLVKLLLQCKLKNICVLCLGNQNLRGGHWLGGFVAQEEDIYRRTDINNKIYINKSENPHYKIDYENGEVLFTPNVCIVRNKLFQPEPQTCSFSVITAVAPYIKRNKNNEYFMSNADKESIEKSINNIFLVAIKNNIKILILGAIGCGMFHNNPIFVRECFEKHIDLYYTFFTHIFFSVYDVEAKNPKSNYAIFKELETYYGNLKLQNQTPQNPTPQNQTPHNLTPQKPTSQNPTPHNLTPQKSTSHNPTPRPQQPILRPPQKPTPPPTKYYLFGDIRSIHQIQNICKTLCTFDRLQEAFNDYCVYYSDLQLTNEDTFIVLKRFCKEKTSLQLPRPFWLSSTSKKKYDKITINCKLLGIGSGFTYDYLYTKIVHVLNDNNIMNSGDKFSTDPVTIQF